MMHFGKRIMAVAAVVLLAAAAICGSTREMNRAEEIDIDNIADTLFGGKRDKETIYFWYTDEELTSFFNSASVNFGEREGVRVIPVLVSDSEYLEAVNRATLHTDQIPDVYLVSHDSLEKAYLAGLACEVEDEADVCSSKNFPRAALDAVSYHGKTVAYPLYFDTSALVYNQTYLEAWAKQQAEKKLVAADEESEKATSDPETGDLDMEQVEILKQEYLAGAVPATVDDILNIADTFDAPEGLADVSVMEWDVSSIAQNYWIVGNYMKVGGDTGDDEGNIDINNPETIQCLEVYKALNQFFSIESKKVTYESVIQDFIDGKTVFTVATSEVIGRLEQAKEDGSFAYEYGITVMPDVKEKLASRSLSSTEAVAVNGYSEHRKLANAFAAYLVTESSAELYDRTGKIPANINTDKDKEFVQCFKREYADSIPMPKMLATGNYWLQLEVLFSKVWNGGDVSSLVKDLAAQIAAQMANP